MNIATETPLSVETLKYALGALDPVESSGGGFIATCPTCDQVGCLRATIADERAKFVCRAGCRPDDIAAMLGLDSAANNPENAPSDDGEDSEGESGGKRFGTAEVVEFVKARYTLAKSSADGKHIAIPKTGPRIARRLEVLKHEAQSAIYDSVKKTPSTATISTAFDILKGYAMRADTVETFTRAAYIREENAVYVYLADSEDTIVRVTSEGWECAEHTGTPVFMRSETLKPLPTPAKVEDANAARAGFADLLGLKRESREFRLIWGWLVGAFFSGTPRPMLWATGEQGSGKTTRALLVLGLVDPADALGGNPGKNERDDSTAAAAGFIPSYDNLRDISAATSDWICRLVTGVTIDRRSLYTDDGVNRSLLMRTAVATSINLPYGLGPDAVERLVTVTFPRIPKEDRMTEMGLKAQFADHRAEFLGALLSDISGVLRESEAAKQSTESLPRMADYARTLLALDLHTGGGYLAAYREMLDHSLAERVADDPFLSAVVDIASPNGWEGTAEALANLVRDRAPEDATVPSSRGMRGSLRNAATALREAGVTVDDRKSNGRKLLCLAWHGDAEDAKDDKDDKAREDDDRKRSALARIQRLSDDAA